MEKQSVRRVVLYYGLLAVGVIAVSFSAIFIKFSAAPPSVLGMNRLLLTLVVMLPWVWRKRGELVGLSGRQWSGLLASGLFLGLHFLGWMSSFRHTTVASSMILLNLAPALTAAGAWLAWREKVSARAVLGMLAALAGTVFIAGGDMHWGGDVLWGDALSLFGAAAVAVHMLFGQKLRQSVSATVYSFVVFGVASAVLACFNAVYGFTFFAYPAREWVIFALLALVPTVFGHVLFNWLLQYVRAVTIQMAVLGEPVGAILLAAILLGERVTWWQAAGGFLSICGIAWFVREQGKEGEHSLRRVKEVRPMDAVYDKQETISN
jgi:drug/metabolite transporter (DMT)-like permease